MRRHLYVWLLCVALLPAAVIAAEHSPAAHEGGSPDIFSGSLGTAVFSLAIFIVLLMVLGKWAWGPILSGLQKREDHIRQAIQEAEKAQAEAETLLNKYKEQLEQARIEAQGIIEKGRQDALRLGEQLKEKAQEEAQSLRRQAQHDIGYAKDQALKEIYQEVTELATDMAAKIIGKTLSPEDHRALLQDSLNRLQKNSNN